MKVGVKRFLLLSNCTPDTILMLLQSPETQEIKYKKETITTFRIPSTPFYPKASQNPTYDVALSSRDSRVSGHSLN